jgi:hypothetical protein
MNHSLNGDQGVTAEARRRGGNAEKSINRKGAKKSRKELLF